MHDITFKCEILRFESCVASTIIFFIRGFLGINCVPCTLELSGIYVFLTLTAAKPALNAYTAVTRRIQTPYNISPIEIGVL